MVILGLLLAASSAILTFVATLSMAYNFAFPIIGQDEVIVGVFLTGFVAFLCFLAAFAAAAVNWTYLGLASESGSE